MVELDQFKYTLSTYDETLKEVKDSLDLENKERRITELDKSMEEPGFWDDPERSTKTVREAKNLKDTVDGYKHLEQQYEDIQVMIEMGYEENDPAMIPEIQEMLDEFVKELERLRTKTLLSGEYDGCNAILKLNAGAGGTEAMDWCSMLYRMYQRWADKKGFTTEVLDFLDGDEAGLKSITLQVNGENAYGYLKSIVWSVFPRSTRLASVRPRSFPVMSCRILKKIWMWRLIRTICGSIPIARVVPVDSISTRRPLRSVSRICRPVSSYSARMSVPSSRTRTRRCRC